MTTLRGMTWDHPRGYGGLVAAAGEYVKTHPDVAVEWTVRSLQAFGVQPLEEMCVEYDLLVVDHPHIPHAHAAGLLLPLEGAGHDLELAELATLSVGPSHASYIYGGHQYGLAIDAAAHVAAYRPDLLDTVPQNWSQVFDLADAGRVLWAGKPVDAMSSLLTLTANHGSPVCSIPEVFLDRSVGLEAMGMLRRLAGAVPAWCLDADPIEIAEALTTSDEWAYTPLTFGYTNYSRTGFRPERIAYLDIPGGPRGLAGSCLAGAGVSVSAHTVHAAEAVEHAFWLASSDVQRGIYYSGGGQPGYASAWEDDADNADCLDFFRNTRATLEQSWVRPRYPGWLTAFSQVGELVTAALRGAMTDRDLLDRAQQIYERSLAAEPIRSTRAQS